jgi:ketosteroid isomerase-like protein
MQKLILFSLIILCSTALADPAEDVRCREIGFSKSVEEINQAHFTTFIDPDARFISNSVTRGSQAVTEAWGGFFTEDGPKIKWRPQFIEVLEDGKLALSRGPYRMTVKDDEDNITEHWGTFNSVWRLHTDGVWRVVFDAGSPASQPPADEVKALLEQEDSCTD